MRYTLERQDGRKLVTTKRERAQEWAEAAALRRIPFRWVETQARFRIKRRPLVGMPELEGPSPWILADRERPAFLAYYRTHERAVIGMHNIVRKEHGLPPLIEWSEAEGAYEASIRADVKRLAELPPR